MTKSILDKTLTSAADLSQQVSSLGELAGANKVVQKTEKIQKRLSQIEKAFIRWIIFSDGLRNQ